MTVAKVDATANDVPDEIQGFPTIKLFRAGKKDEPLDYSGPRSVEDLAAFIRDNGSHKIDPYGENDDDAMETETEGVDTAGMPQQAPAATKATEGVKEAIKSKIGEAAAAAVTALLDSDGDQADHDEL